MFAKIVVGLDGSETAENALRIVCDIARKYDPEVHIVQTPVAETAVFAFEAVAGYNVATAMPDPEATIAAAKKILATGRDIAGEYYLAPMTHIGESDPAHDMVEYAKVYGADLIVTVRRGLSHVAGAVLGSMPQRVAHRATCTHLMIA